MKVFSGRANPELARRICDYLDIPLGRISIDNFPDGEIR
jgi:ribose-phosphate pyrophosphokinase